ncbi:MAG: zinc-dependent peptidase [Ferruginibacter sp.]
MEAAILFIILAGVFMVIFAGNRKEIRFSKAPSPDTTLPSYHLYRGKDLEFSDTVLHHVCEKYNPYFRALSSDKKWLFLERLRHFLSLKDFYVVGGDAYKEMPILISAAATQISFGLQEYHFPHFSSIIIHPQEYIAYDPLRILIGNVQGSSITLSWKHFLEDYQNPSDGKNVGLHEMAHALQVQYLFQNYGYRNEFSTDYVHYDRIDDEVLLSEKSNHSSLFDDNALSNPNEFWATSVELFFERSREFYARHPRLYLSIVMVLNQDPITLGI